MKQTKTRTLSVRTDIANVIRNMADERVVSQATILNKILDVPGNVLIPRMKEGRQEYVDRVRGELSAKGVIGRHNIFMDRDVLENVKVVATRVNYRLATFVNLIFSVREERLLEYLDWEEEPEPESDYYI